MRTMKIGLLLVLAAACAEEPIAPQRQPLTQIGQSVVSDGEVTMQLENGDFADLTNEDLAPTVSVHTEFGEAPSFDASERTKYRERLETGIRGYCDAGKSSAPLILVRRDDPFEWQRLASTDDDAVRAVVVGERERQMDRATAQVRGVLTTLKATDIETFWIAPTVSALVPCASVANLLAALDDEWSVELNAGRRGANLQAYGGEEARNGMRTTAFVSAGYDGSLGNRVNSNNRIRAGIVEWMTSVDGVDQVVLNRNHVAFKWQGGSSRWGSIYRCPGGTCTIASVVTGDSHGTGVARVLAGSIEAGQDPAITTGLARRRRSGMASGASIYYYGIGGDWCNGAIAAVQTALSQHVDVLNWSLTMNGSELGRSCSRFNDCGGLNAAITNATDAGILFVHSIGNAGDPWPEALCNASYPGIRRDGLTVGGLGTAPAGVAYDTAPIWENPGGPPTGDGTSTGNMAVRQHNEGSAIGFYKIADLAAPAAWTFWYTAEPASYGAFAGAGTSFAAPAVAASAMQLRHAFKAQGWNLPSPRALVANMLLMGDGFGTSGVGMHARVGAGRVKMHFPSPSNLTAPWGWGWHTATLSSGQEICFNVGSAAAESASITQWKGALTWHESNYDAVGNVRLRLKNSCPASGPPVVVAQDTSRDIRKRVVVGQAQIGGNCLQACALAVSVPAGQTRTIHIADYYHSGSLADH